MDTNGKIKTDKNESNKNDNIESSSHICSLSLGNQSSHSIIMSGTGSENSN